MYTVFFPLLLIFFNTLIFLVLCTCNAAIASAAKSMVYKSIPFCTLFRLGCGGKRKTFRAPGSEMTHRRTCEGLGIARDWLALAHELRVLLLFFFLQIRSLHAISFFIIESTRPTLHKIGKLTGRRRRERKAHLSEVEPGPIIIIIILFFFLITLIMLIVDGS